MPNSQPAHQNGNVALDTALDVIGDKFRINTHAYYGGVVLW